MSSLILRKLSILFPIVKLKFWHNFSRFIHRIKIGIFECSFYAVHTSKIFTIEWYIYDVHKKWSILWAPIHPLHLQKWTLDLCLKTIESADTSQISRPPTPFHEDVINLWSQFTRHFGIFECCCSGTSQFLPIH